MADMKISQLPALATPTTDDLVVVVDDPLGTPTTKNAKIADVLKLATSDGRTPIVPAQFSWVNQGTATVTDLSGVSLLEAPSSTPNVRLRWKAAPATPYTITALMEPYQNATANSECGIMLRESATDKMTGICFRDATYISTIRYTSVTGAGVAAPTSPALSPRRVWLRLTNNGTALVSSYSADNVIFRQLESVALTVPFTVAPNQAGYFVTSRNNAAAASFLSWAES